MLILVETVDGRMGKAKIFVEGLSLYWRANKWRGDDYVK